MATVVQIIGGFLGAGKTTAIRNQLAARRGQRIAVIVNDFGEASLDAASLEADEPFRVTPIAGGCVCCTAPEGFAAALTALLEDAPDRLLIEPTGLARPQDLVDTIRRHPRRDALELAPVVILVDPRQLPDAEQLYEAGNAAAPSGGAGGSLLAVQVQGADLLVANHTDLCSEQELSRFDRLAHSLWPPPFGVLRTSQGRIPPELLDWPAAPGGVARAASRAAQPAGRPTPHRGPGPGHTHDSTRGFASRSLFWDATQVFDRERLCRALLRASQGLAGAPLARFKGVFHTQEGWLQLEVAGGTLHDRRSLYRRDSRADLLFESADRAPFERLESWLEAALQSERERRQQARRIELVLPGGRVRLLDRVQLRQLPDGIADISAHFPKRRGAAARLRALWKQFDLPASGSAVLCAADGFASEPIPVEALCHGFLLHSVGDEPLPESQGGPFRLLLPPDVPGAPSGCANVKAVTRIVLRARGAERGASVR